MTTLSRPIHEVFINFRGKDIRYGFASHLIDALERHNINFFIDTHEQKGKDLKHLLKRIEEARVVLVILSSRYAESKWCLEELATIIEQAEKREMVVIPIFYKVRPEDVRKQKGVFGRRFWKRTEKSSSEEMEKWQVALKAVSNKIGLTLDHHRSEAKFIKKVVKEVDKVLATIQSDEARKGNVVKMVKTYNVSLSLPCTWFGSAVKLIGAALILLTETVQSDEGREDDCVKKVKTLNVPLAHLPWSWFGSAVRLIGAVIGLLTETVHKCASPAKVILTGQAGSVVSISSHWADNSV